MTRAPPTPAPIGWPWIVAPRRSTDRPPRAGAGGVAERTASRDLVVVIPTFHRPERLANALTAVQQQVDAENGLAEAPMHCSILVIDNDPAGSGEQVARDHGVTVRRRTPTGHRRGSQSGARGVRRRRRGRLLFLDDDETPESGWLRAMIEMYMTTRPTAVAGRVVTRLPDGVEPWISEGDAFARPTRTHGQLMSEAATNNLLLDIDGVRRLGLSFDERFGLTGGSDSMFTLQLTRRGGTIRWAEDAVVIEQEDPAAPHAVMAADACLPVRQHLRARADRTRADGRRPARRTGAGVRPRSSSRPGRKRALGLRGGSRVRCAIGRTDSEPSAAASA